MMDIVYIVFAVFVLAAIAFAVHSRRRRGVIESVSSYNDIDMLIVVKMKNGKPERVYIPGTDSNIKVGRFFEFRLDFVEPNRRITENVKKTRSDGTVVLSTKVIEYFPLYMYRVQVPAKEMEPNDPISRHRSQI